MTQCLSSSRPAPWHPLVGYSSEGGTVGSLDPACPPPQMRLMWELRHTFGNMKGEGFRKQELKASLGVC